MNNATASSLASEEIAHFSSHAKAWWDREGVYASLHKVNPLRVAYVREQVSKAFRRSATTDKPLRGLSVLDVGCGGGLLTEALAQMGGQTIGLDASEETIAIAKAHAKHEGLSIDYRMGTIEDLARQGAQFDVVTAFEIVEHVANLPAFLKAISSVLKPHGLLLMATLNRTTKSYLLAIVAAEYVLGWVPSGTHDWEKFVKPSELTESLKEQGLQTMDLTGMVFDPWVRSFVLKPHLLDVNYLLAARKN